MPFIFRQAECFRGFRLTGLPGVYLRTFPMLLPAAREYWLVYRFDLPGVPRHEVIPELSKTIGVDLSDARRRKLPVAGVQFDIDTPTAGLAEYGAFLKELRSALPANTRVSITALLDWFRSGTAIADVLGQVDEFVPQFYDTGDRSGEYSIAVPIDAARYGPAFEKARKPYRIGAASFGRGRRISAGEATGRTAVSRNQIGSRMFRLLTSRCSESNRQQQQREPARLS